MSAPLARQTRIHHRGRRCGDRTGPVLIIALLLGACPGVRAPLERPRVDVRAVAAVVHEGDAMVRVRLRVVNRNATALRARAVDWELVMAGAGPRRGRVDLDAQVAARASTIVDVTFRVAAPALMATSSGREYALSGTLHLMSERGDVGAVFDSQGEVEWEQSLAR